MYTTEESINKTNQKLKDKVDKIYPMVLDNSEYNRRFEINTFFTSHSSLSL